MVVTLCAVGLHREHGAGLHRLAVQVDRAGPALAAVAADVRAGQAQRFAQIMDQQQARFDLHLPGPSPFTLTRMVCFTVPLLFECELWVCRFECGSLDTSAAARAVRAPIRWNTRGAIPLSTYLGGVALADEFLFQRFEKLPGDHLGPGFDQALADPGDLAAHLGVPV